MERAISAFTATAPLARSAGGAANAQPHFTTTQPAQRKQAQAAPGPGAAPVLIDCSCCRQWTQTADRKWTGTPVGLTAILAREGDDDDDDSELGMPVAVRAAESSPVAARASAGASQASSAVEASGRKGGKRRKAVVETSEASDED